MTQREPEDGKGGHIVWLIKKNPFNASIAAKPSFLRKESKSFSPPKALPMTPKVANLVVLKEGLNIMPRLGYEETFPRARCTLRSVRNVAKRLRYRFSPGVIDRYTAGIATPRTKV
jgi:hypothetical protein